MPHLSSTTLPPAVTREAKWMIAGGVLGAVGGIWLINELSSWDSAEPTSTKAMIVFGTFGAAVGASVGAFVASLFEHEP